MSILGGAGAGGGEGGWPWGAAGEEMIVKKINKVVQQQKEKFRCNYIKYKEKVFRMAYRK